MRYYRVTDDWITYLCSDFREKLIADLRLLDLPKLQKFPPPKITGLPLGNEPRIFSRFVKGKSSQLDASAFSRVYRSRLGDKDQLLYRAFRENAWLTRPEWESIIGLESLEKWIDNRLLGLNQKGRLRCQFCVVTVDGLVFCVDPLKDHGSHWEPEFIVAGNQKEDAGVQPFHHTYLGLDSLAMIEMMLKANIQLDGRYLDCGPGPGTLLLYFGRKFDEAIGIEINERGATLANFNAELNKLAHCTTLNRDAMGLGGSLGTFDLLSWNLPFIFMPEEGGSEFIDAFGGEMGIGLCCKFIETVPQLLSENGVACIAAMAPILDDNTNLLEKWLGSRLRPLGLECTVRVEQISVAHTQELWDFHRSHGIRRFELVYLFLKHGTGQLERMESSMSRKFIDSFRQAIYVRRFRSSNGSN